MAPRRVQTTISTPILAIEKAEGNGTKLHLFPRLGDPDDRNTRRFGPFLLKTNEQFIEDVTIEPEFLTREEASELLRLERWGYVEILFPGQSGNVELKALPTPHLPKSPLLRTLLLKFANQKIYEPCLNDRLAEKIERCELKREPAGTVVLTEKEKWAIIIAACACDIFSGLRRRCRGLSTYLSSQ